MNGTHVLLLLDRSGSMQSLKTSVIDGVNQYLDTLKKISLGDLFFTLMLFDEHQEKFSADIVYNRQPVEAIPPLEVFEPRGWTPLYDAVTHAIHHAEPDQMDRTLIVIFTDGQENRSTEMSRQALIDLIEQKEADGWAFVYLGANQDAFSEAQKLSIPTAVQWQPTGQGVMAAFTTTAQATTAYYVNPPVQEVPTAPQWWGEGVTHLLPQTIQPFHLIHEWEATDNSLQWRCKHCKMLVNPYDPVTSNCPGPGPQP